MNEQKFIDAINAEHGEGVRLAEHVYADWLEEQCDPRSEAWRVLIQAGKRPSYWGVLWRWVTILNGKPHDLPLHLACRLNSRRGNDRTQWSYRTYFAAMNDAVIAWTRS